MSNFSFTAQKHSREQQKTEKRFRNRHHDRVWNRQSWKDDFKHWRSAKHRVLLIYTLHIAQLLGIRVTHSCKLSPTLFTRLSRQRALKAAAAQLLIVLPSLWSGFHFSSVNKMSKLKTPQTRPQPGFASPGSAGRGCVKTKCRVKCKKQYRHDVSSEEALAERAVYKL